MKLAVCTGDAAQSLLSSHGMAECLRSKGDTRFCRLNKVNKTETKLPPVIGVAKWWGGGGGGGLQMDVKV